MWTNENRGCYDRSTLRYPSDLTDAEWALVGPLIPPAKRGGNKRTVDVRAVVNGLMYVLSTGCQWAALPKDLPARSTVNGTTSGAGTRTARSIASITRSMSSAASKPGVTPARRLRSSTAKASRVPRKGASCRSAGLRRGQEGQGPEASCPGRHARLAAPRHRACGRHPGPRRRGAADEHAVRPTSVPAQALRRWRLSRAGVPERSAPRLRPDQRRDREAVRAAKGFTVLPKRWIVERSIAWLNRCRRLAKDWECLTRSALAFLRWASIRLMVRKLCQEIYDPGWTLSILRWGECACGKNLIGQL